MATRRKSDNQKRRKEATKDLRYEKLFLVFLSPRSTKKKPFSNEADGNQKKFRQPEAKEGSNEGPSLLKGFFASILEPQKYKKTFSET